MKVVVMVIFVEGLPICSLTVLAREAALPPARRRRSRFGLRLAAVVAAMMLPVLAALLAPVGEQTAGPLLLSGLPWGILLAVLSRFVLFDGPGLDPGSDDGDDQGPGPGGGPPAPHAPTGGVPLPDAEPSSRRVRQHSAPRPSVRRRPVRERERLLSLVQALRLWSSWGPA